MRATELMLPRAVAATPFVMLTLRVASTPVVALVAADGSVTVVDPDAKVMLRFAVRVRVRLCVGLWCADFWLNWSFQKANVCQLNCHIFCF